MCFYFYFYYSCIDFVLIFVFDFCRMLLKRIFKGKEKVGFIFGIRDSAIGFRRFLNFEIFIRYSDIISHWVIISERSVRFADFSVIEFGILIQNCGWDKLIERLYSVYESLVREFYANFNNEIDIPGFLYFYQIWVRGQWIMFFSEVIYRYYQFIWDNVVFIFLDFYFSEVAEVLLGRANVWFLQISVWHQNEFILFIVILWLFMCYNIESIFYRIIFSDFTVGFIYYLVRGNKIDFVTYIYNQIYILGIWADRRCFLIFPSLISGICRAAGVFILSGEFPEKSSFFIKFIIWEVQERSREARRVRLEEVRRRQQQAVYDEGVSEDVDMFQVAVSYLPLSGEVDTQILRQMFVTMTGSSRDIQSFQQVFGGLSTEMRRVSERMDIIYVFATSLYLEILVFRRAVEGVSDRFSLYFGRMDIFQLRTDSIAAEVYEQTVLFRDILVRLLSLLPTDDAAGSSFFLLFFSLSPY